MNVSGRLTGSAGHSSPSGQYGASDGGEISHYGRDESPDQCGVKLVFTV